jgi:hypothetical protein
MESRSGYTVSGENRQRHGSIRRSEAAFNSAQQPLLGEVQMDSMRFEGRELGLHCEPVVAGELEDGKVYYCVSFVDRLMLIPKLQPLVFVGRGLDGDDAGRAYFQDVNSYQQGFRYDSGCKSESSDATFEKRNNSTMTDVFKYDRALDVLLRCALRRRKATALELRGGESIGHVQPDYAPTGPMWFEARDIKPYAEPIDSNELSEGAIYFSSTFLDDADELLTPLLFPLVFIGRNIDPEDLGTEAVSNLYFQDAKSYLRGIRYGSSLRIDGFDPWFEVSSENEANHVFQYEHALDGLIRCELQRRKHPEDW